MCLQFQNVKWMNTVTSILIAYVHFAKTFALLLFIYLKRSCNISGRIFKVGRNDVSSGFQAAHGNKWFEEWISIEWASLGPSSFPLALNIYWRVKKLGSKFVDLEPPNQLRKHSLRSSHIPAERVNAEIRFTGGQLRSWT